MNIQEIKELMTQFDQSSLREFSYKNHQDELVFSKNTEKPAVEASSFVAPAPVAPVNVTPVVEASSEEVAPSTPVETPASTVAEGEEVPSPLVGVAYLSPAPDKPAFVSVGDQVKKGQTLVIIEAMKVMNEVPAPKDGLVTEILVENGEVVEFGKGLVRIK